MRSDFIKVFAKASRSLRWDGLRSRWLAAFRWRCGSCKIVRAPAAKYRWLPVDENLRNVRAKIVTWRRTGLPPSEEQTFQDYYTKYALRRWTQPWKYEITDCRRELQNELKLAKDSPIHDPLVALAASVIGVPAVARMEQLDPQLSPAPVTVPEPFPVLVTVSVYVGSPPEAPDRAGLHIVSEPASVTMFSIARLPAGAVERKPKLCAIATGGAPAVVT